MADTPGRLALAPLDLEPEEKGNLDPASATGPEDAYRPVRYVRQSSGRHRQPGTAQPRLELGPARELASAIAGMLNELLEARRALWQREAELAAGVPVVPHPDQPSHLAARLEAALRGGAEAVGAQAAALYLLDDATTELKLRACWGLPFDRLTAPARPLRGALADLEAMLGHAVVLEDSQAMRHWHAPEDFSAAVCLPVATAANLLGTLWVFSDKKRDFTETQTNMLEIVAGRAAVELERELLLHENVQLAELKCQLAAANRLRRRLLPQPAPLLDGWQIAGSSKAPASLYDWFCLSGNRLAFALLSAADTGIAGMISAATIRGLVRAHLQYHRDVQSAIKRINLAHWTGSTGDQHAMLLLGLLDTGGGAVSTALAGSGALLHLRPGGWQILLRPAPQLGQSPQLQCKCCSVQAGPGDVLLALVPGFHDGPKEGDDAHARQLAATLSPRLDLPARKLVALAEEWLSGQATSRIGRPQTLLVIKRSGG